MGQLSNPRRGAERRLYTQLRTQIEDGTLVPDAKLPSTRAMAQTLGVSRTTVTAAYEQLAAEGFVVTAVGKAARVAAVAVARPVVAPVSPESPPPALSRYGQRVAALTPYHMASPSAHIDFRYGAVASRDFPSLGWNRAYRAELTKRQPTRSYGQPQGEAALRQALQGYLRRARGLTCDAEQIVVVHGSQQGLDLCARLLLNPDDAFIFEDPGYRMARYCFEATGATALPIPVDASGLQAQLLPDTLARGWPTSPRRTNSRWAPCCPSRDASNCSTGQTAIARGSSRTITVASSVTASVPSTPCNRWMPRRA